MLHDGGGLYLQVSKSGTKSWILRYTRNGRARDMGLGPLGAVSLAEARAKAEAARGQLQDNVDPIAHRESTAQTNGRIQTMADAIDGYILTHRGEWTNEKHAAQWQSTLDTYVKPIIGDRNVDTLTPADALAVLTPIWSRKTETATRVRQRAESVIDAEYAKNDIDKRNPFRWHGMLDKLLPKPRKVTAVEHFAAMPYAELPAFMARLRANASISARALEFTILTAARTGMAIGAERREIGDGHVWTVPAARMKGRKEFEIPLSYAAVALVQSIPVDGEVIFQSYKGTMSSGAMTSLLKYMHVHDVTVHGFRSSFRDWAGNETDFPKELIEEAMSHQIKDKAEAAYRRQSAITKRRVLMEAWAAFLGYATI